MKYPYYSPNLHLKDLARALFMNEKNASGKLKEYYRKVTGKKYILITNSCRSALYLAWKSINKKGEVITSPLTCKVAVDPIKESGNTPVFADISKDSLNIEVSDIEQRITDKTFAIQAIHLGGLSCEMDKIRDLAKRNDLLIVEDCAQSLGATYKGQYTGSFGDISCFSLIKNAYGIGGGIFATDSESIYLKAKNLNSNFSDQSKILLIYRTIRNIIETKQGNLLCSTILKSLKTVKGEKKSYTTVINQLKKVSSIELKIAAIQLSHIEELHLKRKFLGEKYTILLDNLNLLDNKCYLYSDSSFTKYFLFNSSFNFCVLRKDLNSNGIEIKHLEQTSRGTIQSRIVPEEKSRNNKLDNYNLVHDSMISLPLTETMTEEDVLFIVESLKKQTINE